MHVEQLWRYPVKSLRGERLDSALITANGIPGDRIVHVRGAHGVLTGRTRHGLLGLSGSTSATGDVLIDGVPWDSAPAIAAIQRVAGPDADPRRYEGPERFDVMPLLVATDGGIAALGRDGRRLRPNIVIGGVAGVAERVWPGQALRIGDAVIGVLKLRARCIVTTIDPDSGAQDLDVLRRIHGEFDGRVALDCWVARPSRISIGDPVTLVNEALTAPPRGGWIVGAPYLVP